MKKNPGRKERRHLAHNNRIQAGRKQAKLNESLQKKAARLRAKGREVPA